MNSRGFSLVELIVVIILPGLLAAAALPDGTVVNIDPVPGYPVEDRDQLNDRASNMGVNECNRVFAALLNTTQSATNSRIRNDLRANDFFTRCINAGGANPDTCVYYVIDEALINQRPTNAAIDARYPAIVYTPGDAQVVALHP